MKETKKSQEGKTLKHFREKLLKDPVFGLILVMPLLIWVAATLIYPVFNAVWLSFVKMRYIGVPAKPAGFSNFLKILADDEFWDTCIRTGWWVAINVILQVWGSIIVALILNQDFKGKNIVRNWIILPWVLPTIVLAIVWKWILDPTHGVVNYILLKMGTVGMPIEFLSSPKWAMPTVILLNSWRWIPYFSIVVLAALQTVPRDLYEAAAMDGASSWAKFWNITIPTIYPMLKVVTLNSFLWSANIFDTIWLLTRGGPLGHTTTLPIYIYSKAFRDFRFSEAAATSILMFLGLLVFVIVYLRLLFREEGATG